MPRRTLPYGAISTDDATLRPVLDLHLIAYAKTKTVYPVVGVVDSGADQTTLPIEFAKRLGLSLKSDCRKEESQTAGGETECFQSTKKVNAYLPDFDATIELLPCFMELEMVLLGRADFFHHFRVTLHERMKRFVLATYD